MRLALPVLLLALLAVSACTTLSSTQPPPARWTAGFWFWRGSDISPAASSDPVDVLYAQAGGISRPDYPRRAQPNPWQVFASLPEALPTTRQLWLVFRCDSPGVPDASAARDIASYFRELLEQARVRRLTVAGLQLDIDSPTASLLQYAEFLRNLREDLPKDTGLSITALLDWFRDGTEIGKVLAQTDEFVPQFYDTGDGRDSAIASPIDPARWGPVFNRFRKPFKLGISTFGRARLLRSGAPARLYSSFDLRPLDIAANAALQLSTSLNAARETVLDYRVIRPVEINYYRLEPGDTIQFILTTPDTVREAVQRARSFGGYNAGVVFFRWPAASEAWAMQPEEVLAAAGLSPQASPPQPRVHAVSGHCAAVFCADLYLESATPLSPQPTRYLIRPSSPLEYFLPEPNVPATLTASAIEVRLPPFCARGRLYLGRAVAQRSAAFSLEQPR